jgi:hypothetical protein
VQHSTLAPANVPATSDAFEVFDGERTVGRGGGLDEVLGDDAHGHLRPEAAAGGAAAPLPDAA